MKGDLKLRFSVADYHRTRPLLNGNVKMEGIKPSFHPAAPGEACLRPIYEEFDIAEMSLSWYVMARRAGLCAADFSAQDVCSSLHLLRREIRDPGTPRSYRQASRHGPLSP